MKSSKKQNERTVHPSRFDTARCWQIFWILFIRLGAIAAIPETLRVVICNDSSGQIWASRLLRFAWE